MRTKLAAVVFAALVLAAIGGSVAAAQTTGALCSSSLQPLAPGMSDAQTNGEVSALQEFLSRYGTSTAVGVTGYFGDKTVAAVRQFQLLNEIASTGVVSSSTELAIAKVCLSGRTVSFSEPSFLSLSATPQLSGEAQGLTTPLSLVVSSGPSGVIYQGDVEVSSSSWSTTLPVTPVGIYQTALSSDGVTLATGTLAIGITSLPLVLPDTGSLPVFDVADGRLMRFGIHAAAGANVSVGKLTFSIATDSADVSAVSLYAYTDPEYSIPATTSAAGNVVNDLPVDPSSGVFSIVPDVPVTIPAGATYFFELEGTVVPSDTLYSVTTELLGDQFQDTAQPFGTLAAQGAHFIWSPNTFGTSATTSSDWVNGSVLSGLGTGLFQIRTNAPPPPQVVIPIEIPAATTSSTQATSTQTSGSSATSTATSTSATNSSGSATSSTDSFTASPTSGTYPLKVTFAGIVNVAKSCSALTDRLYFGDSSSTYYTISVAAKSCKSASFSTTHTYAKAGTYTAELFLGTNPAATSSKLLQTQKIVAASSKVAALNANLAAAIAALSGSFDAFLLGIIKAL